MHMYIRRNFISIEFNTLGGQELKFCFQIVRPHLVYDQREIEQLKNTGVPKIAF